MVRPRLEVTTSARAGATVVGIEGEIDLSTAPQFERELEDAAGPGETLVVDLRRVDFMDSMGIGVLVRSFKQRVAADGSMTLVCAEGPVRRVLKVSGLDAMIPVFEDLDAATGA